MYVYIHIYTCSLRPHTLSAKASYTSSLRPHTLSANASYTSSLRPHTLAANASYTSSLRRLEDAGPALPSSRRAPVRADLRTQIQRRPAS